MSGHDRLIHLVLTAAQSLQTHLNRALKDSGVLVTTAQSGLLFLLKEQDGQSMTELSRVFHLDNSTVTGLIDRMEKAGLVKRRPDPADRRKQLIHITPLGIEESRRAGGIIQRVNQDIKTGCTDVEIKAFQKVLQAFVTKFE